MSRSQQGTVFDTAQGQEQTNENEAQQSEQQEQSDINSGQSQLAKFAADNPYVQGGEYQTAQNQTLAGNANATAAAGKAAEENAAGRGGLNPQTAVAAEESIAQNAQRTQNAAQGQANTERIGSEAGYNKTALEQGNQLTDEQAKLAALQSGAAQGELGTQEQAAQTPSFLDELGSGLASSIGKGGISIGV